MSAPYPPQEPPQSGDPAAPQAPEPAAQPPHATPGPVAQPPHPTAGPMAQPPYPTAPTDASGVAAPPYPAAPPAGARVRNNPGTVALIAGVAALVLGLIRTVVQGMMIAQLSHSGGLGGYSAIAAANAIFTLVEGLIAIAAIVFGIVGLVGRPRPRAAAGTGLGIGIAIVVGVLTSLLYSGLVSAFVG